MNQACLPTQTAEQQLYKYQMNLAVTLYANGDNWMDIDSATRDTLYRMVQYNSREGYMAGGISALVGTGPVTWPMPVTDSAVIDSSIFDPANGLRPGRDAEPISGDSKGLNSSFAVYPNPSIGNVIVDAPSSGKFILSNMLGQRLREYSVGKGQTELYFPKGTSAGVYMATYKPDDGGMVKEVKIVFQP